MSQHTHSLTDNTVLITGASRRVGACIARTLHAAGANVVIHYNTSTADAKRIQSELEQIRPHSVKLVQANLENDQSFTQLIDQAANWHGELDALINNASTFYPTPVGQITNDDWNRLMASNLKAPLFLTQAAAPYLKRRKGCVVNIVDIHAQRPLKQHSLYCVAKAGLAMLTQAMALELGPEIRVNGVAPGAILWPEPEPSEEAKQKVIRRTFLQRHGTPEDIARTVLFLLRDAPYITGEIITVDGGKSLNTGI